MKLLHAAALTFSIPAAGPGVVGGTSLYRVTRKCCEGGMALSSKACGKPPCSTPTRIMDNSCGTISTRFNGGISVRTALTLCAAFE
jgi:hypothetical protein